MNQYFLTGALSGIVLAILLVYLRVIRPHVVGFIGTGVLACAGFWMAKAWLKRVLNVSPAATYAFNVVVLFLFSWWVFLPIYRAYMLGV